MITVVIPAYNEEKHIADVVKKASKYADYVVVVDNNSTDNTYQVASEAGALVVSEQIQGAGAATRKGFKIAQQLMSDIVITIDGDGQHNPYDIPYLIRPILDNDADVVWGTRFKGTLLKIPGYRKFGIKVITLCCNLFSREWITDAQCGIRAFNKFSLMTFKIEENGYGVMIEQIMKARSLPLRVKEIPVLCYYRNFKSDSGMNPVKQGLLTLLCILKWRFKLWV
jgi:glycosyltransferase involved in cell wall biosynthesis